MIKQARRSDANSRATCEGSGTSFCSEVSLNPLLCFNAACCAFRKSTITDVYFPISSETSKDGTIC